jgi:MHS family proline/betaine transporter-like MFS transporter
VLEWYDFALYGYLAPVTADLFFPNDDPLVSLINTYAIFALGFLARPLGGIVFGHIGDRFGRRRLLTLSVLLMAAPTFLIGLLPTYASLGLLAPLLLAILRLLQGLSTGGEFAGSIILLVEHAPDRHRGLYGSVANAGAMIGGLLGAGVCWLITATLSPEAMHEWGWRLPFLTGILVGAFALWVRLGMPDTPAFLKLKAAGKLARRPLRDALRSQGRQMVLTAGLNWVVSAGYYVVFVWFVTDMTRVLGLSYHLALGIGTLGLVFGLLATLAMGYLSDRIGSTRMLAGGAVLTAGSSLPLLMLAASGGTAAVLAAQLGLALLVAIFLGTLPAVFVSLFGAAVRCSGLALGYNLALALFGGTAPIIATLLIRLSGWSAAPGLYLAATALVCLAALRFLSRPGTAPRPETSENAA